MAELKYPTPKALFTAICDSVRVKDGTTELINHQDLPERIDALLSGGSADPYEVARQIIDNSITEYNGYLTAVGDYAFAGCSNLSSINNADLTSIGNYGFALCSKLSSIKTDNIERLGTYAFLNCQSLTGEYRFEKLTSIGGGAFCGPESWSKGCAIETLEFDILETLTAGSISTSPQGYVNRNIRNVYFGNLKSIPSGSTFYWVDINSIVIATNQLCSLGSTAVFSRSTIENGTGYIYVPKALLEDYKVATNWSVYANQFRAIEDYVDYLKTIYTKIDFSSWEVAA